MSASSHIINRLPSATRPFQSGTTEECVLCVRAGTHSLCVAVYDEVKEKFLAMGDYSEVFAVAQSASPGPDALFPRFFKEVLHTAPFLGKPFRAVRVAWEGDRCTLVPSALYAEGVHETYLSFQVDTGPDDLILTSHLERPDARAVFSIPRQVRDAMAAGFEKMVLFPVSSPLIQGILTEYQEGGEEQALFLNVRHRCFDLVILEGNRLMYHNIFPWQEPADVAYYLLYIMEQFRLGLEKTPLHLLGRITQGDELYRLLLRYVTRASFPAPDSGSPFGSLPDKAVYHTYYSLLNLVRCGS
jgi:hypothetical protein